MLLSNAVGLLRLAGQLTAFACLWNIGVTECMDFAKGCLQGHFHRLRPGQRSFNAFASATACFVSQWSEMCSWCFHMRKRSAQHGVCHCIASDLPRMHPLPATMHTLQCVLLSTPRADHFQTFVSTSQACDISICTVNGHQRGPQQKLSGCVVGCLLL